MAAAKQYILLNSNDALASRISKSQKTTTTLLAMPSNIYIANTQRVHLT